MQKKVESKTWAIIGGGNGGQGIAGHLGILGQKVRLFDVVQSTVDALNEKGGVELHQAVNGFGQIEFATTDMQKAIDGADNIMIVLPSIYHESIARKMIPHLKDGQVVLLHPEACCGAIAFRKVMKDMGCAAKIVLGAACILMYSARIQTPGNVAIYGLKNKASIPIAALPSSDNAKLEDAICGVLPWFRIVDNVLLTTLGNLNAMVHPAPTLLNTSRIEAEPPQDYLQYWDGITPSIGRLVESMDKERMGIAKAFGYEVTTLCQDYIAMYSCGEEGMSLYQILTKCKAYEHTMAPKTLRIRYVLEDIPYSLAALQALAQVAGIQVPCIDAIVTIGNAMLAGELDTGRTAKALGIDNMSKEEFLKFIHG